jgi:hypothetical protein
VCDDKYITRYSERQEEEIFSLFFSFVAYRFFSIFITVNKHTVKYTHTLLTDKHNGCNAGRIPVVNGKVGLDQYGTNND